MKRIPAIRRLLISSTKQMADMFAAQESAM